MSGWGGGYRSQPDRNQAASSNRGGRPPPFHYVHPLLRQLLDRTATLPPGNPETFSEATLAAAIYLAIEMAEDVEQVAILSRIIPEEELARERLARPDVRDLTQEVIFTSAERREVIRDSPEPEEDPVNANAGDCVACGDPGTARMICGCLYCLPCLRRLVRLGLRPDGEFPPRCCDRPLTEATVRLTRRPELVHLFRQLAAEAAVPVFERTYCHDESCATFIPPHRNGVCPICRLRTCPICRGSHEPSARCPEGGPMEDVWQTLDRNNIVNCPQCGRLIQRNGGCNQMRCMCGAGFCYLCGRGHGECRCPVIGPNTRVPMANRPGRKPARFQRRRGNEGRGITHQRIPRLRPVPGEPFVGPRADGSWPLQEEREREVDRLPGVEAAVLPHQELRVDRLPGVDAAALPHQELGVDQHRVYDDSDDEDWAFYWQMAILNLEEQQPTNGAWSSVMQPRQGAISNGRQGAINMQQPQAIRQPQARDFVAQQAQNSPYMQQAAPRRPQTAGAQRYTMPDVRQSTINIQQPRPSQLPEAMQGLWPPDPVAQQAQNAPYIQQATSRQPQGAGTQRFRPPESPPGRSALTTRVEGNYRVVREAVEMSPRASASIPMRNSLGRSSMPPPAPGAPSRSRQTSAHPRNSPPAGLSDEIFGVTLLGEERREAGYSTDTWPWSANNASRLRRFFVGGPRRPGHGTNGNNEAHNGRRRRGCRSCGHPLCDRCHNCHRCSRRPCGR